MKKFIGLLSLAIVMTTVACKEEKETKVTREKEVIVTPPPPRVIIEKPADKNTTITFDKNGVKVETKKVDVDVKKQ